MVNIESCLYRTSKKQLLHTRYVAVVFEWSIFESSISLRRNLSSTKCLTNHLRSVEHSSVFNTNSLHFSMAFVRSSIDASWSSTSCHCSLIRLFGMAWDLSELSSPETDANVSLSNDGLVGASKLVPSTGDDAVVLIKLLNAFGMFARFPRNDCILVHWWKLPICCVVVRFCFITIIINITRSVLI